MLVRDSFDAQSKEFLYEIEQVYRQFNRALLFDAASNTVWVGTLQASDFTDLHEAELDFPLEEIYGQ